jgi:hypothetical protein
MTPLLFSLSYAALWGRCRLDLKAFRAKADALG